MLINQLSHGQRERLTYIDFCLEYFGSVARNDITERFQMGLASSSRDFAIYKELAPDNLVLKHDTKRYYRTESFQPLFEHDPDNALSSFLTGITADLPLGHHNVVKAASLITARSSIVAALSRAIVVQQAVRIEYASLSSGITRREIVPHAFLNSGARWHVRCFDRKSGQFRDFVCTRIIDIQVSNVPPRQIEKVECDTEWQQDVVLQLVPHPAHLHPRAIELDFHMQNKMLELKLRLAEAKYVLQNWNVDVTPQHSLAPENHHLWLKNNEQIRNNMLINSVLTLASAKPSSGSKND